MKHPNKTKEVKEVELSVQIISIIKAKFNNIKTEKEIQEDIELLTNKQKKK